MQTIAAQLDHAFRTAIRAAFDLDADPLIGVAQNEKFGDYQSNAAMGLAKGVAEKTGQKTNPRAVAEQIKAQVTPLLAEIASEISIAGPGFINVRLKPEWLAQQLQTASADERLGYPKATSPKKVVVDYSGPNVAKQMHVGHLRSTIIGDAISRVIEFQGNVVVRQNHIGDFGTQFGMLIHHIRTLGAEDKPLSIEDLDRYYKEATTRFKTDADFKEVARKTVVDLQSGEPRAVALWNRMKVETHRHYTEIYALLGVTLTDADERGESFYRDRLQPIVDRIQAALPPTDGAFTGTGPTDVSSDDEDDTPAQSASPTEAEKWAVMKPFVTISGGATCVFLPGWAGRDGNPVPMMIRKSDGGFPYSATDLAACYFRVQEPKDKSAEQTPLKSDWRADRVIYFTDSRQSQHFAMTFAAFRAAGWATSPITGEAVLLEHAPFGSMLGEDGKPFKTRSGDTVKLKDLLVEAQERALAVVTSRSPELPETQRSAIARAVGIGAVKYSDLSKDRTSDYVFSFDAMLALEGNTAPYMQYAYARIRSIFRRAAERGITYAGVAGSTITLGTPHELALAKHILRLSEVIETVGRELKPHHLCTYLYELATRFSGFFENCPVIQSEDPIRSSRLALCDLTARTMATGLDLLGIEHPEQM